MTKLDNISPEVKTMLCDLIFQIEYELGEENKQLQEKYLNAVSDYETEKSKNVKAVKEIEKELKENNHLSYGVSLAIITILNGGLVIKGE